MNERKIEIYSQSIQNCVSLLNGRANIDFNIVEDKLKPIRNVLRSIHPGASLKFHVYTDTSTSIRLVVSIISPENELAFWSDPERRGVNIEKIMKQSDKYHEIMSEGDNEKLQKFLIGLDDKCKKQVDLLTIARSNENFKGLNIISGNKTIGVQRLPITAREISINEQMSKNVFVKIINRSEFLLEFKLDGYNYRVEYSDETYNDVMKQCWLHENVQLAFVATSKKGKLIKGKLTDIIGDDHGASRQVLLDLGEGASKGSRTF